MPETPITFEDVEVLRADTLTFRCRVRGQTVTVGRLQILPGTTLMRAGDRGRLVMPRWAAEELGLPTPPE